MPTGPWKEAPLAYTVAALSYDPILDFAKLLPAFQNRIRPILPGFEQEMTEYVEAMPFGEIRVAQSRNVFRSQDKANAITLGDRGLLVSTSRYTTFARFVEGFLYPALTALQEALATISSGQILCKRYSIRYIDRVIPGSGEEPEDYVSDHLRHNPTAKVSAAIGIQSGVSLCRIQMAEGLADVRFSTGLGPPPMPRELLPLPVTDDQPLGWKAVGEASRNGVLDTDRFVEVYESFDIERSLSRFRELHDDADQLFRAVITQKAKQAWGCP